MPFVLTLLNLVSNLVFICCAFYLPRILSLDDTNTDTNSLAVQTPFFFVCVWCKCEREMGGLVTGRSANKFLPILVFIRSLLCYLFAHSLAASIYD